MTPDEQEMQAMLRAMIDDELIRGKLLNALLQAAAEDKAFARKAFARFFESLDASDQQRIKQKMQTKGK